MSLRAVAFDLFGTLVDEFRTDEWERHLDRIAEALGIGPEALRGEWEATSADRQAGRLGDVADNVREVCRRLGVEPSDEGVERALGVRRELYDRCWRPRADALATLVRLRDLHVPVALVSQCAPDTPPLWRSSAMAAYVDAEVFSCETGLRKPQAEIYLLACERLGVEPPASLYVGDGSYGELSGAAAVGMRPVLIRDPREDVGAFLRPEAESWDGPTIASLSDVVDVVLEERAGMP